MDGVIREKLPELAKKLGGQSFIMGNHQSWFLYGFYNLSHSKSFAGSG